MVVGKEAVLEMFELAEKCHWKIYYDKGSDNSPILYTDPKLKEIPMEQSRARLEKCLGTLQPGNYRIDFKDEWNQAKGFNSLRFEIHHAAGSGNNNPAIGNMNQPHMGEFSGYVKESDLQKKVDEMIEARDTKRRVAELEELVSELKGEADKNNPMAQLMHFANQNPQIAGMVIHKFLGAGAPTTNIGVAGFNPQQQTVKQYHTEHGGQPQAETQATETTTAENEQRLKELDDRAIVCIQKMIQMEGGNAEAAINLFEKLILWIEQNPVVYESLKPTILATQEKQQ